MPSDALRPVPLPDDLRRRVQALAIEDESDRRQVDRYLAPGATIFRSSLLFLEGLTHPTRMGRKFSDNAPATPCHTAQAARPSANPP